MVVIATGPELRTAKVRNGGNNNDRFETLGININGERESQADRLLGSSRESEARMKLFLKQLSKKLQNTLPSLVQISEVLKM